MHYFYLLNQLQTSSCYCGHPLYLVDLLNVYYHKLLYISFRMLFTRQLLNDIPIGLRFIV